MNKLVKKVTDRVGISEDQAQKAVDIVVTFLKEKLPAPVSSQLDSLLGQGSSATDAVKGLGSKLGL
jgi:nucleoid DNA-binding protein